MASAGVAAARDSVDPKQMISAVRCIEKNYFRKKRIRCRQHSIAKIRILHARITKEAAFPETEPEPDTDT
jgi:hypothetical protein